jgi:NAD(P)-dependent dehydrogenase (short-subunit alcohol dehydrogenase family)
MADITLSFADKTVFVAGGTSGINLGIARNFARAGAKVAVLSRSQDKVDAAVKELQADGAAEAFGFAADVREYARVEEAFKGAAGRYGEIDVLVSGAAGNFPAPAMGMSPNAFKSVIDIDLLGSYHVLRSAFPHLKKPGASVINISAPQAFLAMQFQSHVCAAKAGVDMLTRTLALEWGPLGIRVNSIVPGPIDDTEGMRRLSPTPEAAKLVKKTVPLGRMGHVDDIGRAALFLASPLADYVSGVIMPVDGGWALGGALISMAGITGGLK